MKMIVAIIKPSRLDPVREALAESGVQGMTATEVRGFGRQRGQKEIYRGAEYDVLFQPKIKVEVAVDASDVERTVDAIRAAANTEKIGDGKIFISDLDDIIRIRTGESGRDAL